MSFMINAITRCLENGLHWISTTHFRLFLKVLVGGFREQEDYEGFKLGCIVNFGLDTKIDEEEFQERRYQFSD